jgi:Coenzyme PQQ synthesis protein D (PqqD)
LTPEGRIYFLRQLTVNTPDLMHETIEGEIIAIHLVSGNYYSLRGTAADIWRALLEAGAATIDEVADSVAAYYDESRARIGSEVTRFLTELQEEGLVRVTDSDVERKPQAAHDAGHVRTAFEPPRLEKYTDMQDLVLLDPVHEVGDLGWPARPSELE